MKQIEHARREMFADIPAGTRIEEILQPTYWAHYTRELKPLDVIEAFCEDGSWEASFRVMFVGTVEVKLSLRWKAEHQPIQVDEAESDIYQTKWRGPKCKWSVVRKDDGKVIADGLFPKAEALNYMKNHLRAVA